MSPRQIAPDPSPAEPFSDAWDQSVTGDWDDDPEWLADWRDETPPSRIVIRDHLDAEGSNLEGWGRLNQEDLSTLHALKVLLEMREQLEHEIDTWIVYGLQNGVALRQMAETLAITRQGLSKRLATRLPIR